MASPGSSASGFQTTVPKGGSAPHGTVMFSFTTGADRSDSSSRSGLMRRMPSAGRLNSRGSDMMLLARIAAALPLGVASHAHITRRPSGVSTDSGAKKSSQISPMGSSSRRQFIRPCVPGTNCSACASHSPM